MKKFIIVIIFLFGISFAKANPIIVIPVLITEMYLDNNDKWTIELFINYYPGLNNLNNFKLYTSSGEAQFKPGINVIQNQVILITEESMQSPLSINRYQDCIGLKSLVGSSWYTTSYSMAYGNNANISQCSFPRVGQSIGLIVYTSPPYSSTEYLYVKSSSPSLGIYPTSNANNSKGCLCGYIYDKDNILVTNNAISINMYMHPSTYTPWPFFSPDINGYFSTNLLGKIYRFSIPSLANETIIAIEPDSTTICDFHLNISINNIIENNLGKNSFNMFNYPNPFKDKTTIEIKSEKKTDISKAIIKIFNNNGEIVKILPVDNYNSITNSFTVTLSNKENQTLDAGIYYYTLETEGKKVASNKMTIIK